MAKMQLISCEPEECVTFQIALVGKDGLVVASDRRLVETKAYPGEEKVMFDKTKQTKFTKNKAESVVCFFSGAADSQNQARDITKRCYMADNDLDWETNLTDVAKRTRRFGRKEVFNEIIVVRKDSPNSVWLVKSDCDTQTFVVKITDRKCTGSNALAQFIPSHLWSSDLTILNLKRLALLTLAYAALERPDSVCPPFDIMSLDRNQNLEWSVHESAGPIFADFDVGLRETFKKIISG